MRSEDIRRARVLARVFVRAVRGSAHRVGRPPLGLSVGARLRDRAAEFRPDQLLLHLQPQLLNHEI